MDGEKELLIARSPPKKKRKTPKSLNLFYQKQDDLIRQFEKDDAIVNSKEPIDQNDEQEIRSDIILSRVVLYVNIFLLFAKAAAVVLTSGVSLSIISTLLDSIFDITSGAVIGIASWSIVNTDRYEYPRGRMDLELIAIMTVGLFMGGFNAFILLQSAFKIIDNELEMEITLVAIAILAGSVVIKCFLWFLCWKVNTRCSKILCIDQRNDVLTNIVAVAGTLLSTLWSPYADPIAASLISGYIVISWICVVLDQIPLMTGVNSTREEHARVLRVLIHHHDAIKYVDALLVYHSGNKIVEPLKRKLERLPFVARAFVHPDYECDFIT